MSTDLICYLLDIPSGAGLAGALSLGAELRLLQRSKEGDSYSLHRLVGEVRREEIQLKRRQEWVDEICRRLGNWLHEKRQDFSQLTTFESQIDHLQQWQENASKFALSHSSRLMWLQAYPAYHRGRHIEARIYITEAQRLFDELGDTDLELKANLLNDLASINLELGNLESVLPHQTEALTIRQQLFGEIHAEIAMSLNDIGGWYALKRDFEHALEYSEQALNMRQELFCEPHPDIARSLNNLGYLYAEQQDSERALEYFERALSMRRDLSGEMHPDIADSLSNVGAVYGKQGDTLRALQYSEQALTIRRDLYGEIHPDIASSLSSVGYFYGKQGNNRRALEYMERALAMYRVLYGEQHPSTTFAATWVVRFLIRLSDRQKAYEMAIHFLSKASPEDSSHDQLKSLEAQLLSTTMKRGFRQPPKKGKRKTKRKPR